jgi:hypothetical protein
MRRLLPLLCTVLDACADAVARRTTPPKQRQFYMLASFFFGAAGPHGRHANEMVAPALYDNDCFVNLGEAGADAGCTIGSVRATMRVCVPLVPNVLASGLVILLWERGRDCSPLTVEDGSV